MLIAGLMTAIKMGNCKLGDWQLICSDFLCLVCCPRRLLELAAPLALWPVGVHIDRSTAGHTLDGGQGSRKSRERGRMDCRALEQLRDLAGLGREASHLILRRAHQRC